MSIQAQPQRGNTGNVPILWQTSVEPIHNETNRQNVVVDATASSSKMSVSENSSSGSSMSNYSVLRDADSTVADFRADEVQYYKPIQNSLDHRNQSMSSSEMEVKPSTCILRPHSTPATLLWLEENYEIAEGVCIPRSALYMHYVDFCAKNCIQPVNAASFGKIIRQQFPQLTTRRLGTRGQSRYHYYGIAVRETSPFFQLAYSKRAISGNSNQMEATKAENLLQTSKYQINCSNAIHSTRNRGSTVLPDFPNIKELKLPKTLDAAKTTTFLMMYRTHCQRILDTVIRANFDEVQTFVLHFWKGVPPHLSSILSSNAFVNLIGVCDAILYKSIATVLLPSALQTLPESLSKILRKFSHELDSWLKMALFNVPENLRTMKIEFARRFGQILRRQTSLSHLSQASRMVVNNNDVTSQMLNDWRLIDIQSICREIVYSTEQSERNEAVYQTMLNSCKEFERLIEEDCPIESFLEWLDALLRNCVLYPSIKKKVSIRYLARKFLFLWSSFASRMIREMTVHSASSFGSFHLLRLMFDDYILYLMEYVNIEEYIKDFLNNVSRDEAPVLDAYIPEIDMFDTETTQPVEYFQQPIDQNGYACGISSSESTVCEDNTLMCAVSESETLIHENISISQSNDIYNYAPVEYYQQFCAQQSDEMANDMPRRYVVNNTFASYGYQTATQRVNRLMPNESEINAPFTDNRDAFVSQPNPVNIVYSKENIKSESNYQTPDYRYL